MDILSSKELKKILCVMSTVIFIIYLLILCYLLFFDPKYGRVIGEKNYNLVPFKTIKNYIIYRKYVTNEIFNNNIYGNIIAFVPMGFFVSVIFSNLRGIIKIIFTTFIASSIVEIIQYKFSVGNFDVDDIILNTIGGLIGYIIYRILNIITKKVLK